MRAAGTPVASASVTTCNPVLPMVVPKAASLSVRQDTSAGTGSFGGEHSADASEAVHVLPKGGPRKSRFAAGTTVARPAGTRHWNGEEALPPLCSVSWLSFSEWAGA